MKVLCKRRGFALFEVLVVLVVITILAAVLIPVLNSPRWPERKASCQSNLKQMGLGFLQYAQDYDEKMPRAAAFNVTLSVAPFAKPYGWADAIHPYINRTDLFQCQGEAQTGVGTDASQTGFTDYYFNRNASGVALKYFDELAVTLLACEGNDGVDVTNARYSRNSLPSVWRTTERSPARRHLDTANYLFVDGHVKALKPSWIQNNARPALGKPTFLIR